MQNFEYCMVSVSDRLAPEHAFPTPLNDCWYGLIWAASQAEHLSVDAERILLAGSSSGASSAAAVSLMAHDVGSLTISALILNLPIVCHPQRFPEGLYELDSYQQIKSPEISLSLLWGCYVPNLSEGCNPLMSTFLENLKSLLPHVILIAGHDCLRDEGIAYAESVGQTMGVPRSTS